MGSTEGEFLGIISKIVRSLTNLALVAQEETRLLTMTAKSCGPSFVPYGIPPFRHLTDDEGPPKVENCVLPSKKMATHLILSTLKSQILNVCVTVCEMIGGFIIFIILGEIFSLPSLTLFIIY